jgi:hypothetical protein
LDPVGSGYGPVAGSCEYGDEPSGSGAVELVTIALVIAVVSFQIFTFFKQYIILNTMKGI